MCQISGNPQQCNSLHLWMQSWNLAPLSSSFVGRMSDGPGIAAESLYFDTDHDSSFISRSAPFPTATRTTVMYFSCPFWSINVPSEIPFSSLGTQLWYHIGKVSCPISIIHGSRQAYYCSGAEHARSKVKCYWCDLIEMYRQHIGQQTSNHSRHTTNSRRRSLVSV